MGQSISNPHDSSYEINEIKIEGPASESCDPRSPSGIIRRTPIRLVKSKRPLRENLPDPRSPTQQISRTPITKESEAQKNFDVIPQRLFVSDNPKENDRKIGLSEKNS